MLYQLSHVRATSQAPWGHLAVERWASRVAAENGFVDVTHTLEVFGVCSSCVQVGL